MVDRAITLRALGAYDRVETELLVDGPAAEEELRYFLLRLMPTASRAVLHGTFRVFKKQCELQAAELSNERS